MKIPEAYLRRGASLPHTRDMNVAKIRKRRGLTQADLAAKVGVEQPTISRIERGDDGVTLRLLNQIATALDVEIADIFSSDRSEAETQLIEVYRRLSPERQKGWQDMLALAMSSPETPS